MVAAREGVSPLPSPAAPGDKLGLPSFPVPDAPPPPHVRDRRRARREVGKRWKEARRFVSLSSCYTPKLCRCHKFFSLFIFGR